MNHGALTETFVIKILKNIKEQIIIKGIKLNKEVLITEIYHVHGNVAKIHHKQTNKQTDFI